jgi:hypothetical protein
MHDSLEPSQGIAVGNDQGAELGTRNPSRGVQNTRSERGGYLRDALVERRVADGIHVDRDESMLFEDPDRCVLAGAVLAGHADDQLIPLAAA